MVEWYQSVSSCLERAADYEQKAERAVDPAARQSFLDAANRWRQSAEIYQSMNSVKADSSNENDNSEQLPRPSGSLAQLENRRDRLLRQIEVYREGFAKRIRASMDQIIEAECEDVPALQTN
jgi:hypothetical protein